MNVLFTADWHIKLGQKNVPIDWQKNRFYMLFEQLNSIIKDHNVELLIVGGDIFDRVPTIEELELYFVFLSTISKDVEVLIYSGNHEAIKKSTTFLSNLKSVTTSLHPSAKIIDEFWCLKGSGIDIIPYNRLKDYEKEPRLFHGRILCTHVRGEIPPHVKPEVPLELFDRWEVVLAGDLHSYANSQRNILYPGSPVTTSFHRGVVSTGVIVIDTDTLAHVFVELELPQLIRKTISDTADMVKTPYHHTIYELEGDMQELSKVASSELLDKKVVFKESPSALQLNSEMSIEEELATYLREIYKLDEEKISAVLREFNDYAKDFKLE